MTHFYSDLLDKKGIIQRIECQNKQGKAYRYFTNNFVSEVFINNLNSESKYCFLKKYLPSQRVSSKQYDVWALLKKDHVDEVGGEIISAYCTCTAGLLGSCNHVAGLLFRIEAAVLIGVTPPTCTSILASWNIPSKKKKITPGPVKNFLFKTETYSSKSLETVNSDKIKRKLERQTFLTTSESQAAKLKDKKIVRQELLERISNVVPKSCFVELMTVKKNRDSGPEINAPTILDFAESFIDSCDPELDVVDPTEIFAWSLLITGEQVKTIYSQTVAQSKTAFWQKQRHGRITAFKFKDISETVTRIKKNPTVECPEYLISAIMGYEKSVTTWQMKHGINNEIHAKSKYKSLTKKF